MRIKKDNRPVHRFETAKQAAFVALVVGFTWAPSPAQSPWQNPANRLDVTNDGFAAADDALVVFNEINSEPNLLGKLPDVATSPPFFDVSGNTFLEPLDGFLVVTELNNGGSPVPGDFTATESAVVEVRLEVLDNAGELVESLQVGETFQLSAIVSDKSASPSSVFASYFDVAFDSTRATVIGDPTFGEDYVNAQQFDASVGGIVAGIGGTAGPTPHGEESLLFSLPFRADRLGNIDFVGDDDGAFSLVFGIDTPVGTSFRQRTLQVVPEPTGCFAIMTAIGWLMVSRRRI